jgi:hypothetical protein
VFVDAIRTHRLKSHALWAFDLGRHPRPRSEMLGAIEDRFTVDRVVDFTVHHEYVMCVATPRVTAP